MRSAFGSIRGARTAGVRRRRWSPGCVNLIDGSKCVRKGFPLSSKAAVAQAWLDGEEKYRDECFRDHVHWFLPKEREEVEGRRRVLFSDYAAAFLDGYRAADGSRLTESSMKKKREAVRHLDAFFGVMYLTDITEEDVNRWYDGFVEGGAFATSLLSDVEGDIRSCGPGGYRREVAVCQTQSKVTQVGAVRYSCGHPGRVESHL